MQNKISILSQTHVNFGKAIQAALGKGYLHATLIYEEFFRKGTMVGHHAAFNNASKLLQSILELTNASLPTLCHESLLGTGELETAEKFLLKTHDGLEIESVKIPMQAGGTLCVSSQVGCRMGCAFCETGRMGLLRNLTVEEIVSQAFIARHVLRFNFRNVVFMGMGEPFDNYSAVMEAVRVLNDPHGLAFGRNHITISTSGCIEGIYQLIQEGPQGPNLAVSVNAPNDPLRNRLMPINQKHQLADLYEAMKRYCQETKRQILIAYVLLKDQNDSISHADELAQFLQGLNVKINLIPYNHQSRSRFAAPDLSSLQAFSQHLREKGYYTLLRLTKGQEAMAACGQLGNLKLRQKFVKN